ncbi:hypothetical protein BDA96_04G338900 [Sorghum bicolor]|uniref:Knottin scorpion toxin-like domain-containing protein n=2 Tax=Sorghum bicolor TaxID=4558 RepID=A0A921R8D2_SORBI|nr:hypothetical protein BDA96_04G338900 [Sorghum bicolor]OQU85814.1 hypothetical protein SORBI_3004G316400 [Sorghum bicolor]
MSMRTYHGALLLVLALVMAMLSTGICIGTTPVPVSAPTASREYPDDHHCWKLLSSSGCDQKACNANCFVKLKGDGLCTRVIGRVQGSVACWCYYPCMLSPSPV